MVRWNESRNRSLVMDEDPFFIYLFFPKGEGHGIRSLWVKDLDHNHWESGILGHCLIFLGMIFVMLVRVVMVPDIRKKGEKGRGKWMRSEWTFRSITIIVRLFVHEEGGGRLNRALPIVSHTPHRQHQYYPMVQSITNQRQYV